MSAEPENLIHRLLERMRAEHSASLEAMIAELTATRRVYASMEQVHDKVDRLQADLSALRNDMAGFRKDMAGFRNDMAGFRNDMAGFRNDMTGVGGEMVALRGEMSEFRAETGRSLRQVQSDIVALENQNIARHGEILNILRRLDDIELAMEGEGSHEP